MPEITAFGWFHTIIAILAVPAGIYALIRYKEISSAQRAGKVYLILTLIAAATALGIYRHGGFGIAHGLAVLSLASLLLGFIAEKTRLFGKLSRYVQAGFYSATFLFNMIPAVTEGFLRLPVGSPLVTSLDDPLLQGFHLALVLAFVVGLTLQIRRLRNESPELS
jgi:uncharacterized membrane protein